MTHSMKHEPGQFEAREPRPSADLIEQARADYAADRGLDHAVVSAWLRTWSEPGYKPYDEWLHGWDG